MDWYRGKRVFITGGSSGIGKATALALARSGAHVWISARGETRLRVAEEEIRAATVSHDQVVGCTVLDIGDRQAVQAAAPEVLSSLGGLDVLVNNAGIAWTNYLHEHTAEIFEEIMRVNYFGTVNVTMAMLDHFMKQRSGRIANVSSTLGFVGVFGYAAYAASKFAINGFSECLRQDLLPYGVKVSVLFPADVDTPQYAEENKLKTPETKAICSTAGLSSPNDVAQALLAGVVAGRYHIVPGFMNKATWYATRFAPWLVRLVADGDLMRAHRKLEGTAPKAR